MFNNVQHVKDIILDEGKNLTRSVLIFVCKLKQQQQAGWGAFRFYLNSCNWRSQEAPFSHLDLLKRKPLWEKLVTGQTLGLRVFQELQFVLSDQTITLITLSAQRITFKMKQKQKWLNVTGYGVGKVRMLEPGGKPNSFKQQWPVNTKPIFNTSEWPPAEPRRSFSQVENARWKTITS